MGDRTDCRFPHFFVSNDGFDSWWSESRSRLQLGRRLDLPSWLESSDWYKVKVLIKDGLYSSRSCHNDGFVELLGWEKWQFLQGLSFHGLGFIMHGGVRRKSERVWKVTGNGRKNEKTRLLKGKAEGEVAEDSRLRERVHAMGQIWDLDARRRVGKEMRWILCFGSGNMSWGRRRRWWYTADMGAGCMEKMITCDRSAKGQKTCENILESNWSTWRIEKPMGPTVAAGGTFSEPNHSLRVSGPAMWSTRRCLAMQIPKEIRSGHDSPINGVKKVNRFQFYVGVGAQETKVLKEKDRHCGAQLPEGERRIRRPGTLILHGMHGINYVKRKLAANGHSRKEKVEGSECGVQHNAFSTVDGERDKIGWLRVFRIYISWKWKEKSFKTPEQNKGFRDNPCCFSPKTSLQESMADEFGEWLKVDMNKGRMNVRRKPGIVYASRAQGKQDKEETREHTIESLE
ncbi:hypothetical protein V6N13_116699 [Hibiscus sabdariffa]